MINDHAVQTAKTRPLAVKIEPGNKIDGLWPLGRSLGPMNALLLENNLLETDIILAREASQDHSFWIL